MGLRGVKVVADDSVLLGSNFVAGANESGYHLLNVNYPRDFQASTMTDIAQARAGYACPRCQSQLTETLGIAIGCLRRGNGLRATYPNRDGTASPIVVGSYRLDLGGLMAAVVEQHHDQHGIVWPSCLAPYHIHLIALGSGEEVQARANEVYQDLRGSGYDVLYDDRDRSAGVKFKDADLIGIPVRLTLSRRTLRENAIEVKLRSEEGRRTIALDALYAQIQQLLERDLSPS
jgi:prolyl-tRNA synthetase